MEKKSGHSTHGSSYGRVLTNRLIIGQLSISRQERPGLRIPADSDISVSLICRKLVLLMSSFCSAGVLRLHVFRTCNQANQFDRQ